MEEKVDLSVCMLWIRRGFGVLVLLGLLPTGYVLYHYGLSLAETKPGAFLLQYMWTITLIMAFAVSFWLAKGCQDIKEGHWMYYFSAFVSVVACNNLGDIEKVLGKTLFWLVLVGSVVYYLLVYIEKGPADRFSLTIEEFGRRYLLSVTVLMTPALAYGIGYLLPTWWGCVLAVTIPIVVTLVAVAVWRGNRAQEAAVLLVVALVLELVAIALVVHWVLSLFILGFAFFLLPFYEKREIA